jgi:STE24 endopeptidase
LDVVTFILVFYVASFISCKAWILYLEFRQIKRNADKIFPEELKVTAAKQQFSKSQAYNEDVRSFNLLAASIQAFHSLQANVFLFPFTWSKSAKWFSDDFSRLLLVFLVDIAFSLTVNIPINLYSDFVIQAKHGMNAKTLKVFFMDLFKNLMVGILSQIYVLACYSFLPVGSLTANLASAAGIVSATKVSLGKYWLIVIVIVACFSLIIIFRSFYYIELFYNMKLIFPCRNFFQPLEDKVLLNKIEILAMKKNFPIEKVFQIDAGNRSAHSNAFFVSSLFQKRVIIYDTMIASSTTDEILAVFAHELGHWQHVTFSQAIRLLLVIGIVLMFSSMKTNFIYEFPARLISMLPVVVLARN